jgi:hypothetical protein
MLSKAVSFGELRASTMDFFERQERARRLVSMSPTSKLL